MSLITLVPAYGAKYETKRDVLSDWNSGIDFYILRGCYCSKRNLESLKHDLGADEIQFRWINKSGKVNYFTYWQNEITRAIPTTFVYGPLNGFI